VDVLKNQVSGFIVILAFVLSWPLLHEHLLGDQAILSTLIVK